MEKIIAGFHEPDAVVCWLECNRGIKAIAAMANELLSNSDSLRIVLTQLWDAEDETTRYVFFACFPSFH